MECFARQKSEWGVDTVGDALVARAADWLCPSLRDDFAYTPPANNVGDDLVASTVEADQVRASASQVGPQGLQGFQ